jgi:hypothetical protein
MILDKVDKVAGYRRARRVIIDNVKDAIPVVSFELEWTIDINGTPTLVDGGSISDALNDVNEPLTIYNPLDDSVIMPANSGFVQAVMYSLYLRTVAKDDAEKEAARQAVLAAAGLSAPMGGLE